MQMEITKWEEVFAQLPGLSLVSESKLSLEELRNKINDHFS
jgi:hypothetical protein